jgi:phosphatidylglycerophosphate synthase
VRHQITPLGTFLDPIADKLFALVCFYILWRKGPLPLALITWMLLMEGHLVVIPGLSFLYRLFGGTPTKREQTIKPNVFGKAKMSFYVAGCCLILLGRAYLLPKVVKTGMIFVYVGLALAAVALIYYLLEWITERY